MNTNTRYTYPCLFCGDNTRHRTLILASRDRIPTVILSLYERPFALIRLTEDTNFMGEEEIYAGLIDYRSGSHQVLNYQNDPVSFYERFYVHNIQ